MTWFAFFAKTRKVFAPKRLQPCGVQGNTCDGVLAKQSQTVGCRDVEYRAAITRDKPGFASDNVWITPLCGTPDIHGIRRHGPSLRSLPLNPFRFGCCSCCGHHLNSVLASHEFHHNPSLAKGKCTRDTDEQNRVDRLLQLIRVFILPASPLR